MYRIFILFSFFFYSNIVVGHGDEDHRDPKDSQEVKVDGSGFEIISSAPSAEVLKKINDLYQAEVKTIFSNKCLSCHGINIDKPWYYVLPGAKQLIDYDMLEAKKHMDMTNDFPFAGHGTPKDDLDALKRTIRKGSMPPLRYKLLHWNSNITNSEKAIIIKWINESLDILP